MINRLFKSFSSSSIELIKNSELIEYNNVQERLNRWTIPSVKPTTIYRAGLLPFNSSMAIKTKEQTLCLKNEDENLNLLDM